MNVVGNLHELSASQAAKLFHLSSGEIESLARGAGLLRGAIDAILSRLCSKLSILPGGGHMLGSSRRTARTRRSVRRWLDLALRPWNPEIREPGLKHLAVFCAKQGIAASYVAAMFSCLDDACMEALAAAQRDGRLELADLSGLAKVVRKRLATEELGMLAIFGEHARRRVEKHLRDMERDLQVRADRLGSTVALSQAIADEIDEKQVLRVLAQQVMKTFDPDHLSIHSLEAGDIVDTPVAIVDGHITTLEDDQSMRALRKDWRLCRAARTGHLFHVADVSSALIKCPHQEWEQASGCHCCIPLADGTQVFGWMHLRREQAGSLSAEDIEVLSIYGRMVGTALRSLRLVAENRHQATTDPLTGIGNRRYFQAVLEKEELLLNRRGGKACLLMIDVDHFKQVNDTCGHAVGDRVLRSVANTLREHVRRSDELARIGGDEFVLLLRDCDVAGAAAVAEKILEAIAERHLCLPRSDEVRVTVSIGVAGRPEHAKTLEEASLLADVALLKAKELGRGRCAVFSFDSDNPIRPAWRATADQPARDA